MTPDNEIDIRMWAVERALKARENEPLNTERIVEDAKVFETYVKGESQ